MKKASAIITLALALPWTLAGCGDSESMDFQGDIQHFFIEPLGDLPMGRPHRQGKILALDLDSRALAPLHDQLPPKLRARTPQEVRTIALIHCTFREVVQYNWWTSGYAQKCEMRLVSYPSGELLSGQSVTTTPPERIRLPIWNRIADRPTEDLLNKILELPDEP